MLMNLMKNLHASQKMTHQPLEESPSGERGSTSVKRSKTCTKYKVYTGARRHAFPEICLELLAVQNPISELSFLTCAYVRNRADASHLTDILKNRSYRYRIISNILSPRQRHPLHYGADKLSLSYCFNFLGKGKREGE